MDLDFNHYTTISKNVECVPTTTMCRAGLFGPVLAGRLSFSDFQLK